MEQLGAGSGTEGVQALTERMLHLLKGHDTDVKYDWADCRPSGRHRTRNELALGHGPGANLLSRFQIGAWHPGPVPKKGC